MKDKKDLYSLLTALEGAAYEECGRLAGDFDFNRYVVKFFEFPDPASGESPLFIVRVPQSVAGFPPSLFAAPLQRLAVEDLLLRKVCDHLDRMARFDAAGVARRRVFAAAPGQKILPRTAVAVTGEFVEVRLYLNMPVEEGRLLAAPLKDLFFSELPLLVSSALLFCNLDGDELEEAVQLMIDADQIRQTLPTRGLVGFVAEGSCLARTAGEDTPDYERVEMLEVAPAERIEVETRHAGPVAGLGFRTGLTLIVGDEYQGRRELIHGLAAGIYNHTAGDGRELAVAVPDTVYVRAEPGRSVQRVDLRPFFGRSEGDEEGGRPFSTPAADAFLSQAASTIEALEAGARVLLFDESESSAAFLAAGRRLGPLGEGGDGILPLAACARRMVDELGISMVIGASALAADFIPTADTVLRVDGFTVSNITEEAKALAPAAPETPQPVDLSPILQVARVALASSIDASVDLADALIAASSVRRLVFGRSEIDLSAVEQLADRYQTQTIGHLLHYAKMRYMDEDQSLRQVLDWIDRDLSKEGLQTLSRKLRGDLARPRRYEIAAALNRLPGLRIASEG